MKKVLKVAGSMPTSDGAGVKLNRAIGNGIIDNKALDPFLMLDFFHSDNPKDYIAGFPDHPHRGFETVTYMLKGEFEHRDKLGNRGRLVAGSIQWMTAGRGIIHSEMPIQKEGSMAGFQLWINLPRKDKMCAPRYQDVQASEIPVLPVDSLGSTVKVCCGTFNGVTGPVEGGYVRPSYLDVHLEVGSPGFTHRLQDDGQTCFAFVHKGSGVINGEPVGFKQIVVLSRDGVGITAVPNGGSDFHFILVSASPLNEPVAQQGPFVMSTNAELQQAFADYRAGRLGYG